MLDQLNAAFDLLAPELKSITWSDIKGFGNSPFTTSLVGALAGAFAGAVAAQKIAEKSKQSELLLAEYRSTNAALTIAFSICNIAIAFRRQHATPMCESFAQARTAFLDDVRRRKTGERQGNVPFKFEADLKVLPKPILPIAALENQVYDHLSVVGRPLALVSEIAATYAALVMTLDRRSNIVEAFQASKNLSSQELAARYFGLPHEKSTDTQYADLLRSQLDQANALIIFSEFLCHDLAEHGDVLRARAKSLKLKLKLDEIHRIDFSKAREQGLMPDPDDFKSWKEAFLKLPRKPSWWTELVRGYRSARSQTP